MHWGVAREATRGPIAIQRKVASFSLRPSYHGSLQKLSASGTLAGAELRRSLILISFCRDLSMTDEQGKGKWYMQEAWTDRTGDGRGLHHSRLWDLDGRHIATTVQDGMIRLSFDDEDDRLGKEEELRAASVKSRL